MHYLSLSCIKLNIYNDTDTLIDIASGFYYENDAGQLFVITNWHVVTGRQPNAPSKSKTGAVPTYISFERPLAKEHSDEVRIDLKDLRTFKIRINDSDGKKPNWLEHPNMGFKVDVVAIPVDSVVEIEKACPIHRLNKYDDFVASYSPGVMDSVSVFGFPWGQSVGGVLPIYKRGSVASEPDYNHSGLPRFLIDCRTAPSMSGSPVLVSHSGIWNPSGNGEFTSDSIIGTITNFIGVYSGRLTANDLELQSDQEITELGIVWRTDALELIVNSGQLGTPLSQLV